jgi:hypothetical protein
MTPVFLPDGPSPPVLLVHPTTARFGDHGRRGPRGHSRSCRELDIDIVGFTVHGGSIAVGHPFAATGARIVATLAKTLDEARAKRGLISVCTAGGMGVTAILER